MDYQAVRKKYTLFTRCTWEFWQCSLCVTFAVMLIRTGGVLVIVTRLALAIYLINKWYLTIVAKLFTCGFGFSIVGNNTSGRIKRPRAVLPIGAAQRPEEVSAAYMTGRLRDGIRRPKKSWVRTDFKCNIEIT